MRIGHPKVNRCIRISLLNYVKISKIGGLALKTRAIYTNLIIAVVLERQKTKIRVNETDFYIFLPSISSPEA